MLKGIGASQGFGIGKAVVIRDTNLDYSSVKFTDSDHQKKRLHSAVADFSDETKSLVAELKKNAGNKEAEILEGHLVMLEDPFMLAQMEEAIDNGSYIIQSEPEDFVDAFLLEIQKNERQGISNSFQYVFALKEGDTSRFRKKQEGVK